LNKKKDADENSDDDVKQKKSKKISKSKKNMDKNSDDESDSKKSKQNGKTGKNVGANNSKSVDFFLEKTQDKDKTSTDTSNAQNSTTEEPKMIPQKKNTGGIRILKLTENRDVLIKLTLEADKFEYFRCDEPKITIGVDMHALIGHLKMINDDDSITMYMNKDNRTSLFILATGAENNEETDIEFALIDIPNQEYPLPKTLFQNKITIAQDKFHQICKNLNLNSNAIEIRSIGDQITFTSKSENGKVTMTYRDKEHKHDTEYDKEGSVFQGIYDLKNVMYFSKCNKICSTIDLYLKNDFPLVLVIMVGSLGKMYVFILQTNPDK
jgi:proliferating cell nuclear antigen PCNA